MPFASKNYEHLRKFVYNQGGCAALQAKSIIGYLDGNAIEVIQWPAQSPELNPIENAWAIMKRQLRQRATSGFHADVLSMCWLPSRIRCPMTIFILYSTPCHRESLQRLKIWGVLLSIKAVTINN